MYNQTNFNEKDSQDSKKQKRIIEVDRGRKRRIFANPDIQKHSMNTNKNSEKEITEKFWKKPKDLYLVQKCKLLALNNQKQDNQHLANIVIPNSRKKSQFQFRQEMLLQGFQDEQTFTQFTQQIPKNNLQLSFISTIKSHKPVQSKNFDKNQKIQTNSKIRNSSKKDKATSLSTYKLKNEKKMQRSTLQESVTGMSYSLGKDQIYSKIKLETQLKQIPKQKTKKSNYEAIVSFKQQYKYEDILQIVLNVRKYDYHYKENIIARKSILINNSNYEVGYKLRKGILNLYLTLKKCCSRGMIKVKPNSLLFDAEISINFDFLQINKCCKICGQIMGIRDNNKFKQSKIEVNFEGQCTQVLLPITWYSLAQQLHPKKINISLDNAYKTNVFEICSEVMLNLNAYLTKIFPSGQFYQQQGIFIVNFDINNQIQTIAITFHNSKYFTLLSNKKNFELLKAIISLLIPSQNMMIS